MQHGAIASIQRRWSSAIQRPDTLSAGRARPRLRLIAPTVALLGVSCLAAAPAFAAEATASGGAEAKFLLQVVLLIFAGRALGETMQRIGQPPIMGQLLAGILLGPSILGTAWPSLQHAIFPASSEQKAMLRGIAQFGVLLLLLMTGMETDLKLVRQVGRAAISVALAGVALPFIAGVAFGQLLPDSLLQNPDHRFLASLFLGTALSISSVKIVAMIVREMNFMRRNIGQVIVASAVLEDTIGWIIVAITFSLASQGRLDLASLARSLLGTGLFLFVSFTLGRRAVYRLIRWANDTLRGEAAVISVIVLIMGTMALLTYLLGVQTVLGAFIAGVLIGESPILTKQIDQQLRGLISGLFMPVFFGMAGLSADLSILTRPDLIVLTAALVAIATFGKFAGAFLGAKLGGLVVREALALACAMNARGSTEVIIATIGLSMGLLSQDLFTMIVTMAVCTTLAMPPMLRGALRRLPLNAEEAERLDREEFEAKGFVANLQRLLLAVDESANGRFASSLAGLIAGVRGLPVTILPIGLPARKQSATDRSEPSPESLVQSSAIETADVEEEDLKRRPAPVEVTTRARREATKAAVASEAEKGYDLLMIGAAKAVGADGNFHPEVERAASGFAGTLALVMTRGSHLDDTLAGNLRILLPATGTLVSRRAAEIAVTLARSRRIPITALYVASTRPEPAGIAQGRLRRVPPMASREEAILKDVVELADRYDVPVRTAIRAQAPPDEAILNQAKRGRHNLIVMGVNRRPGERLFFGNVAATVLQESKASVLLVSS